MRVEEKNYYRNLFSKNEEVIDISLRHALINNT